MQYDDHVTNIYTMSWKSQLKSYNLIMEKSKS